MDLHPAPDSASNCGLFISQLTPSHRDFGRCGISALLPWNLTVPSPITSISSTTIVFKNFRSVAWKSSGSSMVGIYPSRDQSSGSGSACSREAIPSDLPGLGVVLRSGESLWAGPGSDAVFLVSSNLGTVQRSNLRFDNATCLRQFRSLRTYCSWTKHAQSSASSSQSAVCRSGVSIGAQKPESHLESELTSSGANLNATASCASSVQVLSNPRSGHSIVLPGPRPPAREPLSILEHPASHA